MDDNDEERIQELIEGELNEVVGDFFEQGESPATIGQALLNVSLDFIQASATSPHEIAMGFTAVQDEVHRRFELLVAEHEAQQAVKH